MSPAPPRFDIRLDPASLERSSLGSITGRIAVQSGNSWFPERSWSDFPVVIIRWWIDAGRALETNATARFLFMDGPFELVATPTAAGRCALSFMKRPREVFASEAAVADILVAIRRVAAELVQECRDRNWQSKELEEIWYAVRESA